MAGFGQNGGFTAITGVDGPSAAAFSSILASFSSVYANSGSATVTPSTTDDVSQATSSADPTNTLQSIATITSSDTTDDRPSTTIPDSSSLSSRTGTTFATSSASTITTTSVPAQSTFGSGVPSTTESNTASSATGGVVHKSDACHSVSCSPGLQAAIAVPVVIGVLAIIGIIFVCMRRRRKEPAVEDPDITAVAMAEKPKKRWSRHLRVFSFDAELLMGGRYSSSNSFRSGETRSVRSAVPSARGAVPASVMSHEPSVNSFDSVAPPYGAAGAHPDSRSNHGGLVALPRVSGQTDRPSTATTAPPPYINNQISSTQGPSTRTRITQNQVDNQSRSVPPPAAVVATESPFNDPPETQNSRSRLLESHSRDNSLQYHPPAVFVRPVHDTRNEEGETDSDEEVGSPISATSSVPESAAASIHEAQVGRSMSVMSGGRAYVTKGSRASKGSMSGSGSSTS